MGEGDHSSPDGPDLASGKALVRRSIELLSSLTSLSHSVKVFAVKWKIIRNKLGELNSGLIAVNNCDIGDNSALSDVISDILLTVNECFDLARRCIDLSYSGKLLMQSDLDVLSAKLDLHVKKLSAIYTAGILTQGYAIVVSRPNLRASREDMKFYVKDLFTRMKVGDSQMKREALSSLTEAVNEDEKYVKILVEMSEIISLLVNYLDSSDTEIQQESAKLVSIISGYDSYKNVLISAGTIAPIIRVLESGSDLGKEAAARSLMKLTENSDNAWSVSAHGGVTALLNICTNGDSNGALMSSSCRVLKNLSGVEEIKRFMVEERAISSFVKLARSRDEVVQKSSIEFLQAMSYQDESIRQLVIKEGGIRTLLRVLDPKFSVSLKTREIALQAIEKMCFCSPNSINVLLNYGFLNQLLFFLKNQEVSAQVLALKATIQLCGSSEEANKAMGDSGFFAEVIKLLESKSSEIREMAAEVISIMVSIHRNRRRFVNDDRNIALVLKLVDQDEINFGNKKFLLSILMSLTSCNSGRRKIVNSGYVKNIEKLAAAEVLDAKKIVRKLSNSNNRFRSMLSGIWHS